VYEAGYATCAPFLFLLKNSKAKLITNMDGLEWKRSKWNFLTKKLMKYLELTSVKRSQYLIADNLGIQQYYKEQYNKNSFFVSYGANLSSDCNVRDLESFSVQPDNYFILIARLEPENNIDLILNAYEVSGRREPFLVIGNYETKYGKYLIKKHNSANIKFLGSIYNKPVLDSLRFYSKAYLHGHSVGGTNPSLLEAMASSSFIIAHNNPFNNTVLQSNALYFNNVEDLSSLYRDIDNTISLFKRGFVNNNMCEISTNYSWQNIIDQYENIFNSILYKNKTLKSKHN
jgi:glycosyltransferase involved in cell wall biosynthesis